MPDTWEQIQDFPAGLEIKDVQITPMNAGGSRRSPLNFKTESQVFPGQAMMMHVQFGPHNREQGGILESFILSLRGGAGQFRFFDPYGSEPLGASIGEPQIEEGEDGVAGSQTVKTDGWKENVANQLRRGDYIQIGERLYRVLRDVSSDKDGKIELTLWPDLREAHPAGSRIITRNATGLWKLASQNIPFGRSPNTKGGIYRGELWCVESL